MDRHPPVSFIIINYLVIVATDPAPTVRPPSRIENLVPSSIAIGEISSTVISILSPGITISTPSGSCNNTCYVSCTEVELWAIV